MSFFSRLSSIWGMPRDAGIASGAEAHLLAIRVAEANDTDAAGVGSFGFDDLPPRNGSRTGRRSASFGTVTSSSQIREASEEIRRLISRVDSHLEQQSRRAERAITMLEGSPAAAESLGVLRDQQERLVDSLEDIADSCRSTREQGLIAMSHLGAVADRLDKASETDERLAGAIGQMELRLTDVGLTCNRLREDLARTKRRQEARDLRIAAMLNRSNRLMFAALVVCASGVLLMGAAAVLALALR
jgi:hypothetical protein